MNPCEWKSKKGKSCPAPGTVKIGKRWLCTGHSNVRSAAEGEQVLEDLLEHGVLPQSDLSDKVAEMAAGEGNSHMDMRRVAKSTTRRKEIAQEKGLEIYRGVRKALEDRGVSSQEAHETAIGEVYLKARYKATNPNSQSPASPFGTKQVSK